MNEFSFTQQEVSDLLGKSRSYIANTVRLIDLPNEVQDMLLNEEITVGHAKLLVNNPNALEIAQLIVNEGLTVREAEQLIKNIKEEKNIQEKKKPSKGKNSVLKGLEEKLSSALHYKSKIIFNEEKQEGKIVIHYNNTNDLENIINKLL